MKTFIQWLEQAAMANPQNAGTGDPDFDKKMADAARQPNAQQVIAKLIADKKQKAIQSKDPKGIALAASMEKNAAPSNTAKPTPGV